MRTNLFRYLLAGWLITLFWFSSASGQTVTGSIAGVVTDPSGAVVLGARVVCENTASGRTMRHTTPISKRKIAPGCCKKQLLLTVVILPPLVCAMNLRTA